MGGFWAGAVPPWAFVALVVLVVLVIGGIALGSWYGYGRGWRHAEEEARWAREQAKARRTHPVYRAAEETRSGPMWSLEVAHEAWIAHEEQALTLANDTVLLPTAVLTPEQLSWTGEIQRMTEGFQRDMERLLGGTDEQLREITR